MSLFWIPCLQFQQENDTQRNHSRSRESLLCTFQKNLNVHSRDCWINFLFSGSISPDKRTPCPRIIQYYYAGQESSVAGGHNCFVREVAKTEDSFRLWRRSDKVGSAEAVIIGMSAAMTGDWLVSSEMNTLMLCHLWNRYIRNQILRQKRKNAGNFWMYTIL